jgi:bifunctional UDP-N-acetylglucosamine pyrophosphorylase/glucosamine-1-phosphate N-acetyltransferase
MSKKKLAAIILAAGQSKRMHREPKAVLNLAGRPLAQWVLEALSLLSPDICIAVVGHEAERVKPAFGENCRFVLQKEPRGTGNAVLSCESQLIDYEGDALVVSVDHPLLASEDLVRLIRHHRTTQADATLLFLRRENPASYGRIILDGGGSVLRIVEEKDASPEERAISETNLGIYCFALPGVFAALGKVGADNAQGEQYLTDVIEILVREGKRVEAVAALHPATGFGINTPEELAEAEALLRQTLRSDKNPAAERSGT